MLPITRRPRAAAAATLAALVLGAVTATRAHAQAEQPTQAATAMGALVGTVRDSSGAPVPLAEVAVIGTMIRTVADSTGTFRLERVPAGERRVRARRLGFRARELAASVSPEQPARLEFVLGRLAQELEAVVVAAKVDQRARYLQGFYVRKKMGFGRFITQERIDARHSASVPDLLHSEIPGVQIVQTRHISQAVRLRGQSCAPLVWLDGMPTPAGEFDLGTIAPSTVAAIEVYSGPATVPGEFQYARGLHSCGVVAIWSRIGGDPTAEPRRKSKKRAPSLDSALAELRVYTADEVDEPARTDTNNLVRPAYPDSLFALNVPGEVVAEFVVDTDGEVRDGTFGIVSATHPLFGESVRRAVLGSKFFPAQKGNRSVPQIMVLPYRFRLDPEDR